MFVYKRIAIAEHERGLYFKDKRLEQVLMPGVYQFFDVLGTVQVLVYDLTRPELDHPQAEMFLKTSPEVVADHLDLAVTGDNEVGLVYYDEIFVEVLPPATHRVFWRGPVAVNRVIIDIAEAFVLPKELAAVLVRARGGAVPRGLALFVSAAEVADHHVGLLIVDGELAQTLEPGFHAFWRFNRSIVVEQLDTRVQPMEVNGQEILTKDKVSLRLNLTAEYRVSDAVKARSDLKDPVDWLYRQLQLALRQAVGARTLDNLLGSKDEFDQVVFEQVVEKAAQHGLTVTSVGAKDVILPGDMKEILNQVVEAEKAAQANIIRRREETAATRSLLNTARLMDENPTLLRLKELEMLEKVTEKVDRLTVFGGLDGVLKETVRINV